MYSGKDLSIHISDLQPYTTYNFKLRTHTEGDDSPFSETIQVTTDEAGRSNSFYGFIYFKLYCLEHAR